MKRITRRALIEVFGGMGPPKGNNIIPNIFGRKCVALNIVKPFFFGVSCECMS